MRERDMLNRKRFPLFFAWTLASVSVLLAWVLLSSPASAQYNLLTTGRVVGHVYLSDLDNRPARLAKVWLRSAGLGKPRSGVDGEGDFALQIILSHSVTTDMNGMFVFPNLPPGSYYVFVDFPGYQSAGLQFTDAELRKPTPDLLKKMEQSIPKVRVETGLTSDVSIQLRRGAVIAGTVRYDDGSPASGAIVEALYKQKSGNWRDPFANVAHATADDLGNFRLSGLPPGRLIVKCSVRLVIDQEQYASPENNPPAPVSFGQEQSLDLYNGGVFRAKDAKLFELKPGAELTGMDLVIPLAKMYRVAGSVTSFEDGHALNSGNVALLFADDSTTFAEAPLLRDGRFQFALVPEGEYVMSVGGQDVQYSGSSFLPAKAYEHATQPISVRRNEENIVVQLKVKPIQATGF